MGNIVTAPATPPGPRAEYGVDLRNCTTSEPWFLDLPTYQGYIDRLAQMGAQWVRLGVEAWRIGDYWGDAWHWAEAGKATAQQLLIDQVRYAHSKGLRISLTWLPERFVDPATGAEQVDDATYLARNTEAGKHIASLVGEHVSVVQILNEVNSVTPRGYQPVDRADAAATLANHQRIAHIIGTLRAAWQEVAPHSLCGTNTFGYPPRNWYDSWIAYYDVLHPVVDYIGLDVYPGEWDVAITECKQMMERIKARFPHLPIFILESGFQATTAQAEADLGMYYPLMAQVWRDSCVDLVLYYTLRDVDSASTSAEDRFGILTSSMQPKGFTQPALDNAVPRARRAGWVHGEIVTVPSGASTDATSVTWRVIGGGGRIVGTGATVTYLPPGRETPGSAVLGVTVDGGTEQQITVPLAAHPRWTKAGGTLRPTTPRRLPA